MPSRRRPQDAARSVGYSQEPHDAVEIEAGAFEVDSYEEARTPVMLEPTRRREHPAPEPPAPILAPEPDIGSEPTEPPAPDGKKGQSTVPLPPRRMEERRLRGSLHITVPVAPERAPSSPPTRILPSRKLPALFVLSVLIAAIALGAAHHTGRLAPYLAQVPFLAPAQPVKLPQAPVEVPETPGSETEGSAEEGAAPEPADGGGG